MKIYTTQILKEKIVSRETGKEEWKSIDSFCKDGNAYLDITRMTGLDWLAPEWKTLKNLKAGKINQKDYKKIYLSLIKKNFRVDPSRLEWLNSLNTVVLSCYCKPGNFCHRYILADFLGNLKGNRRLGELPKYQVKNGLKWLQTKTDRDFSRDGKNEQVRELTHLFLKNPPEKSALEYDENGYTPWDKKSFSNDNWIFQGTENAPNINDTFDAMSGDIWTYSTDKDSDKNAINNCKNAIPLHYGEIGAQSLDAKFRDSQLDRQIWEDCSKTGDGIKIPQIATGGTSKKSPIDIISQYARINHKQAATVNKCYKELAASFNIERKLNHSIRKSKKAPWNINLDKALRPAGVHMANSPKTLIDWVFELKHIDIIAELKSLQDPTYEDWTHYDDGVFNFRILDDMAASAPAGLQEVEMVSYNDNIQLDQYKESGLDEYTTNDNAGLFTYWNTSTILTPDELKNKNVNDRRRFRKILSAILSGKVTRSKMGKLKKFISKLSPAQRTAIKKASIQMA